MYCKKKNLAHLFQSQFILTLGEVLAPLKSVAKLSLDYISLRLFPLKFCICFSFQPGDKDLKTGNSVSIKQEIFHFLMENQNVKIMSCCLEGSIQKSLVLIFYSPKLLYIYIILKCTLVFSLASWKGVLPLWICIHPWSSENEQCLLGNQFEMNWIWS